MHINKHSFVENVVTLLLIQLIHTCYIVLDETEKATSKYMCTVCLISVVSVQKRTMTTTRYIHIHSLHVTGKIRITVSYWTGSKV